MESRLRVLVLDEADVVDLIAGILSEIPECELHSCSARPAAASKINEIRPDILLVDHRFAEDSAADFVGRVSNDPDKAYVIVSLPEGREDLAREYQALGARQCIVKGRRFRENIVPVLKKIIIQVLEEKAFVVSVLSRSMRDFLGGGPENDLFSMLPVFGTGQEILHYRVIGAVGQGGMGEVYRAEDLNLKRPVALKVLPLSLSKDENARQRFLREAQLSSSLNHPNIVHVYAIEESNGIPLLAMEYVEGKNLSDLISDGPLPLVPLLDIGAQVADALSAAHSLGLIHRDIKSENIMITSSGQIKLLDFGLAKRIALAAEPGVSAMQTITQLSISGVAVGSVHYMSPEQTTGKELDCRSDLFSLGCVLYEAATGKRPFEGKTMFSIMFEIANTDPPPPSSIHPGLPQEFDAILRRAMAKDRSQRYSHASEIAIALRELKAQQSKTKPN